MILVVFEPLQRMLGGLHDSANEDRVSAMGQAAENAWHFGL
jgi:hypothetical protein